MEQLSRVAVGHFWWRRETGVGGNVKTGLKLRKAIKGISTRPPVTKGSVTKKTVRENRRKRMTKWLV